MATRKKAAPAQEGASTKTRIENTTDHSIDISYLDEQGSPQVVTVPAAFMQESKAENGGATRRNGSVEVDSYIIDNLDSFNPVVQTYFDVGHLVLCETAAPSDQEEQQ